MPVTASHCTVTSPASSDLTSSVFLSSSVFTMVPVSRSPFLRVTWSARSSAADKDNDSTTRMNVRRIRDLLAETRRFNFEGAGRPCKKLSQKRCSFRSLLESLPTSHFIVCRAPFPDSFRLRLYCCNQKGSFDVTRLEQTRLF